MADQETSQTVIRNTIFSSLEFGVGLIVSLLLTPYIIAKLGLEQYGIFALVGVLISFCSLLDVVGTGRAFVKYVAEFSAREEHSRINELVSLGFSYYFIFWCTVSGIVYLLRNPILALFKFPPELHDDILFVLCAILLVAMIRASFAVFRSVLLGLQRLDVANSMKAIISVLYGAGAVVFLSLGFGLRGLAMNGVIMAALAGLSQMICCYRLAPWLRFRLFSFSKETVRFCFGFGIRIQIAQVSEIVSSHVDKLLLGHFVGMIPVAGYTLGAKIANIGRSVPGQLLPAIVPAASHLEAIADKRRLHELYCRGSKYLAAIALPLTVFMVIEAPAILQLWLGTYASPSAVLALQVLPVAYTAGLLVSMARLVARGMGIPQFEMRSALIIAVVNIVLSTVLIIKFGFVGALIGTTCAAVIGSVYFLFAFHSFMGRSFIKQIGSKVYPVLILACVTAGLACWGLGILLPDDWTVAEIGRWQAFKTLALSGITFAVVFGAIVAALRYFDEYDRTVFLRLLKLLGRKQ
ncbi:MAG: oligosaccharide flippase family protein [Kiritimatiellia bacterium]